jgi:hypothetical protein
MSDLSLAERAEKLGISKEAMGAYEKEMDREKSLEVARIGSAPRDTDLDRTTKAELDLLIEQGAPNNAETRAKARRLAIEKTGLAGPKAAGAQEDRITKAWEKIDDEFFVKELQAVPNEEKEKVARDKQAAKDEAARRLRTVTPTDTAPKKDDKVALGPNKDAGGTSVLAGTTLPETAPGPNGKTLYLHPDGKYRAYIPAGR